MSESSSQHAFLRTDTQDWRQVYDFWFPPGLDYGEPATCLRMLNWWMRGGANAELQRFTSIHQAALVSRLDHWRASPLGRLSLILVLDQFTRGLRGGSPEEYACDSRALQIAEESLRNRHYDALVEPWERFFFLLPLGHAEGPDHLDRMKRLIPIAEAMAVEASSHLQPIFRFSASQARETFDVISRFGRFPHRNEVLGRSSTPEELAYLEKGDFVHTRSLPSSA